MASRGYGAAGAVSLKKGAAKGPNDTSDTEDGTRQFPYEVLRAYQPHPASAQSFQNYGKNGSASLSSASSSIHSIIMDKTESKHRDPNETLINVMVRVRPFSDLESQRKDAKALYALEDKQTLQIVMAEEGQNMKPMTFHRVLGESTTQQSMFDDCGVIDLLDKAIDGYSATVFAFGQTSSGKTYTMTGPDIDGPMPPESQGIIPRALHYIFHKVANYQDVHFTIKAAYMEIYNEQVKDLLNAGSNRALPVRWKAERGFYVENIFVVECEVLDDMLAVLEEGLRNRKTAAHRLNEHSSRSHSIMTVYIESESMDPEDNRLIRRNGKISFVDLAGSEKVKESKAAGSTFTEMLNINKSLLTLALADSKRRNGHIPYRDSKLTKLLADSLGGNGFALMISCISPSIYNLNETLKTLRYASRAKNIKNRPVIQMDPREELILHLKRENKILRNENNYLRNLTGMKDTDLSGVIDGGGDGVIESKGGKTPTTGRNTTTTTSTAPTSIFPNLTQSGKKDNTAMQKELEQSRELLVRYAKEIEFMQKENIELQQSKNLLEKECQELSVENEKLINKLERLEKIFQERGLQATIAQGPSMFTTGEKGSKPSNIPIPRKPGKAPEIAAMKPPNQANIYDSGQKIVLKAGVGAGAGAKQIPPESSKIARAGATTQKQETMRNDNIPPNITPSSIVMPSKEKLQEDLELLDQMLQKQQQQLTSKK